MNFIKMLLATILTFTLYYGAAGFNTASADDDEYEEYDRDYEEENEAYEDIGELVGWGTVIALCTAGAIFPMRRLTKSVIAKFPEFKKPYISITKFFGRYHIFIGLLALILSISHGIMMYLSEGELESEGVIGLVSVIVMVIATIMGAVLFKNKKIKVLRTTHITLIVITLFLAILHILIS